MPEVYDNDSGIIARAVRKVCAEDMGAGQTSVEAAIAAMNTKLTDAGEPYTLPTSIQTLGYGVSGAKLVNPEDCPEVRILVAGWGIEGVPSGVGQQGFDRHTFTIISYLSRYEGAGSLNAEEVLALQALDWEKIMVHAIRRRPDYGIWHWGQGSVGQVGRPRTLIQGHRTTLAGEARAVKITQTWRIGQDARY